MLALGRGRWAASQKRIMIQTAHLPPPPPPKPTLTLTSHLGKNVGLGEG